MAYEHDIFISYSRVGATSSWLEKHLVPMLEERLNLELGRRSSIFFDKELSTGGTWPVDLGHHLGRSRILLALWSKPFLHSDWCAREISIMRAREQSLQLRTPENPNGTIAISVIHDGENMPHELGMIQQFEIKDYYNTRMTRESALAEALYERISDEAVSLARMIENVPPFQEEWPLEAADAFFDEFFQSTPMRQTAPPRFSI
ncbi:MAG: TIR domain-containing protein [Roseobacter sp.]